MNNCFFDHGKGRLDVCCVSCLCDIWDHIKIGAVELFKAPEDVFDSFANVVSAHIVGEKVLQGRLGEFLDEDIDFVET